MNAALVYDWIYTFGGAERILLEFHRLFPKAPLFTLIYDKKATPWADIFNVKPSFLQNIPYASTKHELFPFLTPLATESFDFSEYDMVISLSSSDIKGIITLPKTLHLSYILTPTRYLWSHESFYFNNKLLRFLARPAVKYLKRWDLVAKSRPDHLIAVSETVRKRIKEYYNRDSYLIYPPVTVENFKKVKANSQGKYFLVVSRLVPAKRVDIAIKACNKLNFPLVIIGKGRSYDFLKNLAGNTITFTQNLTEDQLISYYQNCRALIIPSEEDFGITAVEAQSAGKPVIYYKKGGVSEIVRDGLCGAAFHQQTEEALVNVLVNFREDKYNAGFCRKNSEKFERQRFARQFKKLTEELWEKHIT